MEDSVKLTNTQLVLLSAASQRDDRALERPANLLGGAQVVAKLLAQGFVEEVQSRGSLPVWRRDGDRARSLRITKKGLQAILAKDVEGPDIDATKKPPAPSVSRRKSTTAPASPRESGRDKSPARAPVPSRPTWLRC
jgi:hypothetical protein